MPFCTNSTLACAPRLEDREAVLHAYRQIMRMVKKNAPQAEVQGIWVTRMVKPGQEVILGVKRDRTFGPVVLFGLGGIYVEIFKDVSFRVAPLYRSDAGEMIREIRTYLILAGSRCQRPMDVNAIEECIQRLRS
jgi:acyl-CoA synthetase (NDP forming)